MEIQKLFEAAYTGNVELLHKFLQEEPLILANVALASPTESLLHVAAKAGQLNFARELIKHSRELARELSKDGFRPLDIASMAGNVEMVIDLLRVDNNICRLKGKEERTALHYAAIKGRVGVIDLLLSTCPNAVEDVTVYGETALHLAVKNHQIEAFSALLGWFESPSMEPLINWADCNGNTVLHLAASRKQLQILQILLSNNNGIGGMMKVNATNSKGLTAVDLLDIVMESPNDVQLSEILRRAGALRAHPIPSTPPLQQVSESEQTPQPEPPLDIFEYFKYQQRRDSPGETRNALLVVAALIGTITFQAGVNPPTGLRESTSGSYLFWFGNTLGLSAAGIIIGYLTAKFPFQRELQASMSSMFFTYGVVAVINERKEKVTNLVLIITIASSIPFFMRWLPRKGKKAWERCRQNLNSMLV